MKYRKLALILLTVLISGVALPAQSIDNIQFPPSVKWKQIETEYCILIFPESLEAQAADFANLLDSCIPAVQYSLNTEAEKWPVIINNTLIESNAYVQGAPEHSQLYTIPSQDGFIGTADWTPAIWSHELRHIVQNDKMKRGFTAFAGWIAGEYGTSGMPHFALPRWVWEGDAVLTETLLSSGGRGRIAGFERGMRTNLLNGIRWNYNKAGLGGYASYITRVPSWYVMGYHLCTHIRQEYGIEAFNRILEISTDFSFTPLILNIAVKKVTGKSIESIYEDCLDELYGLWSGQLTRHNLTETETILSAEMDDYTSYYPLGEFDNGETAVLRTSASSIYSLMKINNEGEPVLLRKINPFDMNISFNGSTFCWVETRKDARWGALSWSEIRLYNPAEKIFKKITKKTRYLSPSISPDGTRIAAVETTAELKSFIVVLDASDGRLISRIAEPEGASALETCWSEDGKKIIYIRQQNWQKSLRLLNPGTKTNIQLTEPSGFNISDPAAAGDLVYYISEESGLENIHAVSIKNGSSALVVSRPHAAASPAPSGSRLFFADYSAAGFAVAAVNTSAMNVSTGSVPLGGEHINYFSGLESQEEYAGFLGPVGTVEKQETDVDYEIRKYYPVAGLINFHSRIIGTSSSGSGVTLDFLADDILNYSSGRLYAGYDADKGELLTGLSGAWAGFLPVLLYGAEIQTPATNIAALFQSNLYGGFWLPLDFSSGIHRNSLGLQSLFILESTIHPYQESKTAAQASASWDFTEYSAKRDLQPPLGFTLSAKWYRNIAPSYYNFIFGSITGYLPGLLENHGIKLNLEADYNFKSAVEDKNPEAVPRGYRAGGYRVPLMINTSINYCLPAVYPDFNLGGVLYIPRLSANCFLDTAFTFDSTAQLLQRQSSEILQSTGIEIFTDFHLFNTSVPLKAGLRFLYDIRNARIRIEDTVLLLGIDLK